VSVGLSKAQRDTLKVQITTYQALLRNQTPSADDIAKVRHGKMPLHWQVFNFLSIISEQSGSRYACLWSVPPPLPANQIALTS
jgi:hypothetical protein